MKVYKKMINKGSQSGRRQVGERIWPAVARMVSGGFGCLLALLVGCSGPSQQVVAAQVLAQRQAQAPAVDLQQQLLLQASQLGAASYRDYQVGPEDLLAIEIYGQDKLNREVRVNGQGDITLPLVGVVKVAGLTTVEIEKKLTELYDARFLVNPQISVTVKEFRHQRVAVTGAVAKPGSYEIIGPRTLLEVLALAGGIINVGAPTGTGAQAGDVVHVIRPKRLDDSAKAGPQSSFAPQTETVVIDLRQLVSGREPRLNLIIRNGDVIHVPFAGTAYVLGGVRRPGNVPVKEHITVAQAIAMTGGIDPILGTNNITVVRFDDQGQPQNISLNLKEITTQKDLDLPLKDNDVVVVKESPVKKTLYILRTLLPIPSGSYAIGY